MPFNDLGKNKALDGLDESVSGAITHIGVGNLTDPGTGTNYAGTEATGGSPAYARQAVTWGAAASGQKSNSGALTFDVPAGTYGFLLLFNASTGNTNNYLGYLPINGSVKGFFSVDTTLSNDQFFSVAHGLADGDRVQLFNVFSESLPTGLTEGTVYYVVSSATNTFKVSTTLGGSAVDITAVGGGEGYFQKVVPEVFGSQGQITVAIGAAVLDATGI
ncbi:phage tail fiber protein [Micrococcus luteus]|uniref:phage tail fiber protein n=1 Tax=Micrococcus luteus TaxID=1270 RepID=UPI00331C97F2